MRGLVGAKAGNESDFIAFFEEPHFVTFGAAYEKRPRFSAGAYAPVVKRLEGFLDEPVDEALKTREARADLLLKWDDEVVRVVEALKAKGLQSPYLKNYVVARVNFLRFKKDGDFEFDDTIQKMIDATKKIDPAQGEQGRPRQDGRSARPKPRSKSSCVVRCGDAGPPHRGIHMSSRLTLLILAAALGSACGTKPPVPGPPGPEICNNKTDDNGDGKVDCARPQVLSGRGLPRNDASAATTTSTTTAMAWLTARIRSARGRLAASTAPASAASR